MTSVEIHDKLEQNDLDDYFKTANIGGLCMLLLVLFLFIAKKPHWSRLIETPVFLQQRC